MEGAWTFTDGGADASYTAFSFTPRTMPGFFDYYMVYNKFRLLKAEIAIKREQVIGQDFNSAPVSYLFVGSRPFAESTEPIDPTEGISIRNVVPNASEAALRQTKWQREQYPNNTTQVVKKRFKPYTVTAAYGPYSVNGQAIVFQKVYEARRWMPMVWAVNRPVPSGQLQFFGPYMCLNGPSQIVTQISSVSYTLTLWCQFAGQR